MSYAFFSRSADSLRLEGQRRARLREQAAIVARRLPPDGADQRDFSRRTLMRSAERFLPRSKSVPTKSVPAPPAAAVIALNRMGFGPRPGDVDAFNALGATDDERFTAYAEEQLDPASIDDSAADARIVESGFTTLDKSLEQLWQDHMVPFDMLDFEEVMRPVLETELATFLRAIHSKRQLFELLVDSWHNHFNIFAFDIPIGPIWVHFDRDVIRANALGNFRQMLESVATSTAMLFYLDNAFNSAEDANENYARELMELHTLGAASYFGSIPESEVPKDATGRPLGYVEETVIAAARCLTGWTVSANSHNPAIGNTGTFLYHDPWHDHDPKTVLGTDLPANQASMQDGRDLLDLLAEHPGTATHIATKLCRRLIGDSPPPSVIDAAAAVFAANTAAPDQIAQTVRTILLAPEFLSTWGEKVKRPFEIAVSSFRAMEGDLPFEFRDGATRYFLYSYLHAGQPLFQWSPPNGFPDVKTAWNSSSPRVMAWRLPNLLVTITDDQDVHYVDLLSQTPPTVRSAFDLVTFWTERMLGHAPPQTEFDELVDFMAQGTNPAADLPLDTDWQVQERLRALVALILMSPSFLWR